MNEDAYGAWLSDAGVQRNVPTKTPSTILNPDGTRTYPFGGYGTKEAQQHIVNNTFEYPMIEGVKPNKLIAQFGLNFKQDLKTKVSSYGKNQAAALKVMTEAGWE